MSDDMEPTSLALEKAEKELARLRADLKEAVGELNMANESLIERTDKLAAAEKEGDELAAKCAAMMQHIEATDSDYLEVWDSLPARARALLEVVKDARTLYALTIDMPNSEARARLKAAFDKLDVIET